MIFKRSHALLLNLQTEENTILLPISIVTIVRPICQVYPPILLLFRDLSAPFFFFFFNLLPTVHPKLRPFWLTFCWKSIAIDITLVSFKK